MIYVRFSGDFGSQKVIKPLGFLTRYSRMKERKKPGQPGARARFQFSKR
jgi:small subunit ribosomal protein S9